MDYVYDGPLLRSIEFIGDTVGTVGYGYNNYGLVSSQTINAGSNVSYTYDDDDLMLTAGSATISRSATTGWIDGVTVGDLVETLSHDTFGDVDGSLTVYDGTDDVYEYDLVRDQLGRIVQDTQTVESGIPVVWEYEYDARGRLHRVDKDGALYAEYDYDANGNRLSVTTTGGTTNATYDSQDRILTFGTWTYTHSANGEIVAKTDGMGTWWTYKYDVLGNLAQLKTPSGTTIKYDYDARGRVVARYVNGVYDKGWLWGDQLNPVAEVDSLGNVTARYVYGSRGHVPDYVIVSGETYRILTDFRGSVRAVVDGQGNIVQEIEYGPWGEVLSDSAPGFQPFGYAGGIWDADTNLILFGARWYDPELGRWTMRDPVLFRGRQANLYAYVENNPIVWIDPTGLGGNDPWYEDAFEGYLHWTWGLPTSFWGAVQFGAAWASGGSVSSEEDVWVVTGGLLNVHGKGRSAWTLGQFVIAGESCSMSDPQPYEWLGETISNLDHEDGHQDQSLLLGPLYIPAVAILYGMSATHHAYNPHPDGFLFPSNLLDRWANAWAGNH